MAEKLAIVEHVSENHHRIQWEETSTLGQGRVQEPLVKEALHITLLHFYPDDNWSIHLKHWTRGSQFRSVSENLSNFYI